MILGFPRAKQGLCHYDIWGGDPSLIRYYSKTAEQNFMKLSGIVQYMMPYCNSYFNFLSTWFWDFPEQNKDFAITTYGGGGPISIRYFSKTVKQNFMKLSGLVHYMMPYCTSYFKFLSAWFWGFPEQNKDFAITTYGEGGPISNPLLL